MSPYLFLFIFSSYSFGVSEGLNWCSFKNLNKSQKMMRNDYFLDLLKLFISSKDCADDSSEIFFGPFHLKSLQKTKDHIPMMWKINYHQILLFRIRKYLPSLTALYKFFSVVLHYIKYQLCNTLMIINYENMKQKWHALKASW